MPLGSIKQRVVLGALALHANRPIGREQLIAAVWGADAPTYAVNLLQKHVSGLRQVLDPIRSARSRSQVLSWTDAGYLLSIPHDFLDLERFDRGVTAARAARAAGDLATAAERLHNALGLWRGPLLDGLTSPLVDAERDRLAERHIVAVEERIEIDLALGDDQDLVAELRRLVAAHPLRERLRGLLMRALYRDGRQAEALAAFHEAREHLLSELGIDPTPELQHLHQRILSGDAEVPRAAPAAAHTATATSPAPAPGPAQLPHGLAHFTGRTAELDQLTELAGSDQSVMIAAITGTAGVGKTSLALQWAHRVAPDFPDGQLYVNLRGFDPHGSPMEPGEVLRGFLEAFGVAAQQIPAGLADRAASFRSLLAGRRVLVVLDNARDTEQVLPLLPGTPGSAAVVTSRRRLSALVAAGAVPVTLDLLTANEAALLLARRFGAERAAAEPQAVTELVTMCARLPLALAIVAARAAAFPHHRLAALAAELREATGGLDAFMGENESSDARAVLSWSYQQLSDDAARLFRLLGLHPGPEITYPAAASLAGVPVRRVRRLLTELSGAHLLEERAPGRFTFHDLLRAYAAEQAEDLDPQPERGAATHRVLDHYLHSARAADRLLYAYREQVAVDPPDPAATVLTFADADAALSWFAAEQAVLVEAIAHATELGFPEYASRLTWTITAFLNYQGKWDAWETCLRAALTACARTGDLAGAALAHRLLSLALLQQGALDAAAEHTQRSLELFDRLGDLVNSARLHLDLGRIADRQGEPGAALERARLALGLFREAGDRSGEADALNWIGRYSANLGNYADALRYCRESLALHGEADDYPGQADTWDTLGFASHQLGDYAEATTCYERALALWRRLGDRYEVATTLLRLGDTRQAAGDAAAAGALWREAGGILDDLGHPQAAQLRDRLTGEIPTRPIPER
ncbi:AfsR/SARP family transcriptional regulator [Krasilnikovia cinnamomea]|uniref:AfsR/SARP family transcriptional regulator n=1 Tax=Krasilnikovia cinnamomea TaxID=349313 RepID=UPI0013EEEBAB|nr:BTAD domain-containing putative transcriptional regulator [Krasilnikovia cinnamomea]